LRIQYRLPTGQLTDQPFALFAKAHNGRSSPHAFGIGYYNRLAAFHNRNDRIGGSQIYADYSSHSCVISGCCFSGGLLLELVEFHCIVRKESALWGSASNATAIKPC
jgi:hypothetical protein